VVAGKLGIFAYKPLVADVVEWVFIYMLVRVDPDVAPTSIRARRAGSRVIASPDINSLLGAMAIGNMCRIAPFAPGRYDKLRWTDIPQARGDGHGPLRTNPWPQPRSNLP
jgi:hypothetical protein